MARTNQMKTSKPFSGPRYWNREPLTHQSTRDRASLTRCWRVSASFQLLNNPFIIAMLPAGPPNQSKL